MLVPTENVCCCCTPGDQVCYHFNQSELALLRLHCLQMLHSIKSLQRAKILQKGVLLTSRSFIELLLLTILPHRALVEAVDRVLTDEVQQATVTHSHARKAITVE